MKFFATLTMIFSCYLLQAQYMLQSSESMAMGGSGVAMSSLWSGCDNQAAYAWTNDISVGAGYNNRFIISQLSNRYITIALPLKNKGGVFSANINQFGFSAYRISKGGLAYSRLFGDKFAAGLQFDLYNFNFGDKYYGKNTSFSFEGGIQYRINKQLSIGTHIFNPVRASLSSYDEQDIPSSISLGLALSLSKNATITADVVKESPYPASLRAGFSYLIRNIVNVRAGFSSTPFTVSGGVGINLEKINIDFSSIYHQTLGVIPSVSLMYHFKKNKR